MDCAMVKDHTPKCHQHQEQSVQQPLTKELRSTDLLALSIRGGYQYGSSYSTFAGVVVLKV